MKDIRAVLTFRASSIGDCLMGKYFLENVHAQFPRARCGLVIGSHASMVCDLLEAYPWIEIVEANRAAPRSLMRLWREWRGAEIVLTQYAGKPGGRFALSSKLAARVLAQRGGLSGFSDASRWNRLLYDVVVPQGTDAAPAELERRALRALGLSVPLSFPGFAHAARDGVLERFSLSPRRYALVHLFASGANRRLKPERAHELVARLSAQLPGMPVVLTGGKADRAAAEAIAGPNIMSVAGETTLQELAELVSHCAIMVSVDTGVAHMAAGMRTPLIVLGICTAGTCTAGNWWIPAQYAGIPVDFFTRSEYCPNGHVYETYPRCLNGIDLAEVAAKAGAAF